MRYKKTIAIILVTGMVVGTLGGMVALFVFGRQNSHDEQNTGEVHTKESGTHTPLLGLSERPSHEQATSPETAESELDVGKIERETSPTVIGGSVEYETKEPSRPVVDLDEGNEAYLDSDVIAILTAMDAEGEEDLVNAILDGEIQLINHFVKIGYGKRAICQIQRFYYDFYDQLQDEPIAAVIENLSRCIPSEGADLEGFAERVQSVFGWGSEWSYDYVIDVEENA